MNKVLTGYEILILREPNIATLKSELDRKAMVVAIAGRNCNLAGITYRLNSAKSLVRHNYQISMN